MTPFRERNPVVVGAVGLAVIAALLLFAFNIDKLPYLSGTKYTAAFCEAGGLKPDDEVRIAGVKVGKVTGVDLDGDHVRVTFRVNRGTEFGKETSASVRIKTVLGQKFLMLEPKGPGQLASGSEIPISRTVAAYDVVEAFSDLATTAENIDTEQLRQGPGHDRHDVRGHARRGPGRGGRPRPALAHHRLPRRPAARAARPHRGRLRGARRPQQGVRRRCSPTATCCSRSSSSAARTSTSCWSTRPSWPPSSPALVRDNRKDIGPALQNLRNVVVVLRANQDNLDKSIELMAPFVRVFANTLGNGRWFDTYVENLVPVEAAEEAKP